MLFCKMLFFITVCLYAYGYGMDSLHSKSFILPPPTQSPSLKYDPHFIAHQKGYANPPLFTPQAQQQTKPLPAKPQETSLASCKFQQKGCWNAHPCKSIWYVEICGYCLDDYVSFLGERDALRVTLAHRAVVESDIYKKKALYTLLLLTKACCNCKKQDCTKIIANDILVEGAYQEVVPLCETCVKVLKHYLNEGTIRYP